MNDVLIYARTRTAKSLSGWKSPFSIGNGIYSTALAPGAIDEVIVYSTILSPTEIHTNYTHSPFWYINQGISPPIPDTGCPPISCNLTVS